MTRSKVLVERRRRLCGFAVFVYQTVRRSPARAAESSNCSLPTNWPGYRLDPRFAASTSTSKSPGPRKLVGRVVASLAINRESEAYLCIYPISRAAYPKSARDELSAQVLPRFCQWLQVKKSRSNTAILGHEQIVAEWTGQEYRCYEMRFL